MPTYEYECESCAQRVEAVQKFTDPALTVCPHCGGALRKVFSSVGIVFKGSGFYKNDSRNTSSSTKTPAVTGDTAPASSPAASTAPAPATSTSSSPTSTPSP